MAKYNDVVLNTFSQSLYAQGIDLPNYIKSICEKIVNDNASISKQQLISEFRRLQWFENMGTLIIPREMT